MSQTPTATGNSTVLQAATAVALPLVLIADADAASRERRADQLRSKGFRVAVARTPFEAIVKASCHLPDLIVLDTALGPAPDDDPGALLSTCPATAHIPIVRLAAGRQVPARLLAKRR